MKNVCVFCGSRMGNSAKFLDQARSLGKALAEHKVGLVFGGADMGLMGNLADTVLEYGGKVKGVIPQEIAARETAHKGLSELLVVGTLAERKLMMVEISDAFVALPGGFGTLDELFEVLTLAQIGQHQKPCILLNEDGFFDGLVSFLDGACAAGFISTKHREMLKLAQTPEEALTLLGC